MIKICNFYLISYLVVIKKNEFCFLFKMEEIISSLISATLVITSTAVFVPKFSSISIYLNNNKTSVNKIYIPYYKQ